MEKKKETEENGVHNISNTPPEATSTHLITLEQYQANKTVKNWRFWINLQSYEEKKIDEIKRKNRERVENENTRTTELAAAPPTTYPSWSGTQRCRTSLVGSKSNPNRTTRCNDDRLHAQRDDNTRLPCQNLHLTDTRDRSECTHM